VSARPLFVQRQSALGIRFHDLAGATSLVPGLLVEVFPQADPRARCRLQPNGSGLYVAHGISGLRDFENDASDDVLAPWERAATSPARGYRVEVRDPLGRFLPVAFDVDLPIRGLLGALAPWVSPALPAGWLEDSGSPAALMLDPFPLFSTPSRPPPAPLAVVYAQMRAHDDPRIPAGALLGVGVEGVPCGIGMADAQGRVVVMFPYPEPPRPLRTSPSPAHFDFLWTVTLQAFWTPPPVASPAIPAPDPDALPDLRDVLAQLDTPRSVIDSLAPVAVPWRLDYRVPLTVRTGGQAASSASYLMLSTA